MTGGVGNRKIIEEAKEGKGKARIREEVAEGEKKGQPLINFFRN
jgi:hypothetical protein